MIINKKGIYTYIYIHSLISKHVPKDGPYRGQSLSVRPDVLNEIFLAEFQEFQDTCRILFRVFVSLCVQGLGFGLSVVARRA